MPPTSSWSNPVVVAATAASFSVGLSLLFCRAMRADFEQARPQCNRTSLTEILDDGERPKKLAVVDIIAVHGLGSQFPSCWTEKDSGVMFLKEFLPVDFPQARILTFVYPTESFSEPVHVYLNELGNRLLCSLARDRDKASIRKDRPIIFIGHSFGGLVIKQALVQAADHSVRHSQDILDATRGILFLGTPHTGSGYSRLGLCRTWISHFFGGSHTTLLYTLLKHSQELASLNERFLSLPVIQKIRDYIVCFFELKEEAGALGIVVDEESACLPSCRRISLNTSHEGMNKFSNSNGEYHIIRLCIQHALPQTTIPKHSISRIERFSDYQYAFLCTFYGLDIFEIIDHSECCKRQTETEWILTQRCSGHSGTFVIKHKERGIKIAVTIGVHNYAPWLSVSTDIDTETAETITGSFYDSKGKRAYHPNHWNNVRVAKGQIDEISMIASIEDFEDIEGKYRATIELAELAE